MNIYNVRTKCLIAIQQNRAHCGTVHMTFQLQNCHQIGPLKSPSHSFQTRHTSSGVICKIVMSSVLGASVYNLSSNAHLTNPMEENHFRWFGAVLILVLIAGLMPLICPNWWLRKHLIEGSNLEDYRHSAHLVIHSKQVMKCSVPTPFKCNMTSWMPSALLWHMALSVMLSASCAKVAASTPTRPNSDTNTSATRWYLVALGQYFGYLRRQVICELLKRCLMGIDNSESETHTSLYWGL